MGLLQIAWRDIARRTRCVHARLEVVVAAVEVDQQVADRLGRQLELQAVHTRRLRRSDVPGHRGLVGVDVARVRSGHPRGCSRLANALVADLGDEALAVVTMKYVDVEANAMIEPLVLEPQFVGRELLGRNGRELLGSIDDRGDAGRA